MDIESLQAYCLQKPAVEETLPFGPDVLVYKVAGKIFLLCGLDTPELSFSVKCDPEKAIELREQYAAVKPGYHLNKQHWNTITVDGSMTLAELHHWIDHSYELVKQSLPAKTKKEFGFD